MHIWIIAVYNNIMGNMTHICLIIILLFINTTQITYKAESSTILPKKIFAGEIHFARIPVEYWQHRILMIKALGLNAMSVYVMWNYHEIQRGRFDYRTQNKNLPLFLELAEKHNMSILLRPGPYVCAQWDFGGLPVRLYGNKNLKIRDNNKQFLDQVRIYFATLAPIIKSHLKTDNNPKGSIILLQIQNQYGSYGSDLNYINALRKIWDDLGVICEQYHQDGPKLITNSHWKGANIGLSGGTSQMDYSYARSVERTGLIFGGQIYTGWLTHWGQKWQKGSTQSKVRDFGFLLSSNYSFSMYMVHGGTNFALTAGANSYRDQMDYKADVTSYDYDSPINQQGGATPKYHALKQLISQYVDWSVPNEPAQIKRIQIPRFKLSPVASMLLNLGTPAIVNSQKYYHFESDELKMYNQGFVVYETKLVQRQHFFEATIRDFAVVLLDDNFVVSLDRSIRKQHNFTIKCEKQLCVMRIVVEAMGHINYAHEMETDIKGLFNITDDLGVAFTWNIYKAQIDCSLKWNGFNTKLLMSPTLLKSVVELQTVGDTYLDASELTKGYIFVNGRNLGRYWNKGPQTRLFCPGVWLKQGANTIHVLQLLYDGKEKGITGKLVLEDNLVSHIM